MPGIIIHTLLGRRLLDRWSTDPASAPFPVHDPGSRAAFLAGTVGPDMGMYPGGEPLFSDLAHYVRSGELTRALIRRARSGPALAFAWGWATHVLADALIHPLINIAAGDAQRRGPLTYADDPWLHLAVEIGADGCLFAAWRELGSPAFVAPPTGVAESVASAYRTVYGPIIGERAARASLAAWFRWHQFGIAIAGAASENLYGRPGGRHGLQELARRLAKLSTGIFARRSRLHGLTHPLAPSGRAESLIHTAITEFPDRFRELERTGLDSLPNYNLDTGAIEETITYPLAVKTLARLDAVAASAATPE